MIGYLTIWGLLLLAVVAMWFVTALTERTTDGDRHRRRLRRRAAIGGSAVLAYAALYWAALEVIRNYPGS